MLFLFSSPLFLFSSLVSFWFSFFVFVFLAFSCCSGLTKSSQSDRKGRKQNKFQEEEEKARKEKEERKETKIRDFVSLFSCPLFVFVACLPVLLPNLVPQNAPKPEKQLFFVFCCVFPSCLVWPFFCWGFVYCCAGPTTEQTNKKS